MIWTTFAGCTLLRSKVFKLFMRGIDIEVHSGSPRLCASFHSFYRSKKFSPSLQIHATLFQDVTILHLTVKKLRDNCATVFIFWFVMFLHKTSTTKKGIFKVNFATFLLKHCAYFTFV